ncbi:MAG: hybrid sensor histidine kinase/response regulator [Ignavibacteriaceae bacterium]|nr:hybrid sensor histidine kinase/response regulator [Ignavibacteriaceae bacterium]
MINSNQQPKTILIVDDIPANISILFTALEEAGFTPLVALNGTSAIERAMAAKPALILLDIMMPGIDGYQTCVKLKSIPVTKEIPVIFMTALTDVVNKVKGFEAGGVDYIIKPFQIEEVVARINTHIALVDLKNELKTINENLEKTIDERTKELTKVVKTLKNEIVERKKIESQLLKAKEEAEKSDKLKTFFLAQISHEIRTPIYLIHQISQTLKQELQSDIDKETKDSIEILNTGSKRLLRTFDQMLNMSQLQSQSYKFTPELINLRTDIIDTVVEKYLSEINQKSLHIKINDTLNERKITADKYSLSVIFDNLINNSISFTESGFIEIDLSSTNDERTRVAIIDTGIGIGEEYLSELFTLFSQESTGYSRKYDGSGLGLAIVKKFCELNGAHIDVTSQKNAGTVFTVTFNQ